VNFVPHESLSCPLDQLALQQVGSALRCDNGHSFDIASQGYVNLLGAHDKRSHDPGDSKAMVAARRAFLNGGHYQPIARRLTELVGPLVSSDSVIADAGCGEGYYLEQLRTQLESDHNSSPAIIGFDISKWAVKAAARRLAATWLVASNRNIPVAPDSIDCLLSLFGFPVYPSFRNTLRTGGTLLTVNAGPQHLIELREIIYPSVRHSDSTVAEQARSAGFTVGESRTLEFKTAPLSQLEVNHLLQMTPHLFRASQAGKDRAAQLNHFPVTVEVIFQLLQKPAED
jgi:23S rRNA (guanine745-N1)-methyltransferase